MKTYESSFSVLDKSNDYKYYSTIN